MTHTLTLVASKKSITKGLIRDIADTIENATKASASSDHTWLNPDKALDIPLPQGANAMLWLDLHDLLDEVKADFFITPYAPHAPQRRKKLLLADMDSTIVAEETLDELAAHAGLKDKIAAITTRAMNGELDFHDAIRARVSLLKDLPITALTETLAETTINPGAKTLVQTMKKHGAHCVLVSGGFTFFTESIAQQCGFDHHHGNVLGIDKDQLNGAVIDPIQDRDSKLEFLKHYTKQEGITLAQTMTIGDGANDLPMLEAAQNADGLGIGYKAKKTVTDDIHNTIRHGDLSTALYAQGYTNQEFVI